MEVVTIKNDLASINYFKFTELKEEKNMTQLDKKSTIKTYK